MTKRRAGQSAAGRSRAERSRAVLDDIRSRLQARMHLGLLRPGDRVLSARQQAERLGVDPRVAMAAYRELEREGLVVRRERSGVFLAETAQVPGSPEERLTEWAVEVLLGALARGIRVPELPGWLRRATVGMRAVCIECNADQLHGLCDELGGDYGFETEPMELQEALHPTAAQRASLRSADLLVTTSSHARDIARIGSAHARAYATVDMNPEWGREISHLLANGPVYVVATDPRFARKLRSLFLQAQGASNLHVSILGKDDPARIPSGVPVVVTRMARLQYRPDASFKVLPELRVFSPDSARQLLRHLVRSNAAHAGSVSS